MKLPVPEPSVVLFPAIVGFWDVPQQTPRAVTAEPLSESTVPPPVAVVVPMLIMAMVATFGASATGTFELFSSFLHDVASMVNAHTITNA